jgi:hypothetical protein
MTDKEIKQLLSRGKTQQFSLNPDFKGEISRATIDEINRSIRKSLAAKHQVRVLVVVE